MTAVGKILVFLNLVFSLVVGGFAVVDYAARSHWADAYAKVVADNQKLRGAGEAYKTQAERADSERENMLGKFRAQGVVINKDLPKDPASGSEVASLALKELEARASTIEEMKKTVTSLRNQMAAEKSTRETMLSSERAQKSDTERRVKDTELLRGTLKTEMDKNFRLEQEKNQMRDDMVTAQITARTLKDRNTQMETQIQDLAKSLAQLRTSGGAAGVAGRGANPPSENVEGQVARVEGNLVSLTVGGDNGLAKGQTMELFRLGTNPRYIGRVRLVAVEAKTSVGQLVGRPTMPVQSGDKAASKILGGY